MSVRLDKFLADAGEGSRSEVKALIRRGLVTVNGHTALPDQKISPESDRVESGGRVIRLREPRYYLLNKPAGYVCAAKDNLFPVAADLIPDSAGLFSVGRLDRDTEGLLLFTDDGELAHRLISPRRHVDKTYLAVLDRLPEEGAVRLFSSGLDIGDPKSTLPAVLELLPDNTALLTVHEGRFHQVKRMFRAVGCEVLYLKRVAFGPIRLPEELEKGGFRRLTAEELDALRACVQ